MSREDIHKLVGGYATGTLTPEEREALFAAALDDQELFDALAREQALRDLLRDPAAKAHLLAALDEPAPRPWYAPVGWLRPASALAVAAMVLVAVGVVALRRKATSPALSPPLVAELKQVEPPHTLTPAAEDRNPLSAPVTAPGTAPAAAARKPADALRETTPAEFKALPPPPPAAPMAAPSPPTLTVDGIVTDPTGAAIPSATVTVASGDQVLEEKTQTNPQGNWSVQVPKPGIYQVSVAAPGFRTVKQQAEIGPGDGQPVKLQLAVGDTAETVQVSAGNAVVQSFQEAQPLGQQQQQQRQAALTPPQITRASAPPATAFRAGSGGLGGGGGSGGRPGAVSGAVTASARQLYNLASLDQTVAAGGANTALASLRREVPVLALRYVFLKKGSGGDFAPVDPSTLKTGDTLQIQITPAAGGYLTVTTPAGIELLATPVERLRSYTTPPLPVSQREVAVTYSRQAPTPAEDAKDSRAVVAKAAPEPVKPVRETVAGATYVAGYPTLSDLQFKIALANQ